MHDLYRISLSVETILVKWAYIVSTTIKITTEWRSPRLKKAGPADPVLKAKMLKFAENQTKNI